MTTLPHSAGRASARPRVASSDTLLERLKKLHPQSIDLSLGRIERLLAANGVRNDLDIALFDADHGRNPVQTVALARKGHAERPSIVGDDVFGWALARAGRCAEALPYSNRALRLGTKDALKIFHRIRANGFEDLLRLTAMEEADPFDVLCHLAFNAPIRSRLERAQRVRSDEPNFWAGYSNDAREVLSLLLDRYAETGATEFRLPDVLKVAPLSGMGNAIEISARFGGPAALKSAVTQLQQLIYAA